MLEALFLTDAKWRGDVRGVPQPEVAGGPSAVNPLRRAEAAGVCVWWLAALASPAGRGWAWDKKQSRFPRSLPFNIQLGQAGARQLGVLALSSALVKPPGAASGTERRSCSGVCCYRERHPRELPSWEGRTRR